MLKSFRRRRRRNVQRSDTAHYRAQQLIANHHTACRNCGAPGFWHDTPGVNVGCYAPDKVTQLGNDPVGEICPNCGAPRPGVTAKGVIWSKQFRPKLWPVMKAAIWDVAKAVKRSRR